MKNAPRVPRPARSPSPYTRYKKTSFKYGNLANTIPEAVMLELRIARTNAAANYERLLETSDA